MLKANPLRVGQWTGDGVPAFPPCEDTEAPARTTAPFAQDLDEEIPITECS